MACKNLSKFLEEINSKMINLYHFKIEINCIGDVLPLYTKIFMKKFEKSLQFSKLGNVMSMY